MTPVLITNARVRLAGDLLRGSVAIRDGTIAELQSGRSSLPAALDFDGDYPPHALLRGAVLLRDQAGWALPKAVSAVSANPARLVGLADRGTIAVGKRADLVRVRETKGVPVPLATRRQGIRIA